MEIEIRAKIENLTNLKKKLINLGATLGTQRRQFDVIYKKKGEEGTDQGPGSYILRIRDSDKGKFLTFKALTERRGVWEEYELKIDNVKEAKKILEKIGFIKALTLTKERTPGKLDEFNFNLDNIKELGSYIEVELIDDDGRKAQEKIKQLLFKLGISENQLERRGYPEIIFEAQGMRFNGQK
ncbi:class IV adenylate cyclase [Patescibacteria group bacterium]|nr:class IV adenylate cyclase [Patescibacteria group bacterium]